MGAALDLFVYVVYVAPIGSKHKSKSLFQNLATIIAEVQTLGGIILLGGDFNAHTGTLPDTIDINNLCELLQVLELVEAELPNIVAKRQTRDTSVGGWGCELLDLCYDIGLFIFNGRTPGDELGEFTCLANGGRNNINLLLADM
jgi:hypothetical protein